MHGIRRLGGGGRGGACLAQTFQTISPAQITENARLQSNHGKPFLVSRLQFGVTNFGPETSKHEFPRGPETTNQGTRWGQTDLWA